LKRARGTPFGERPLPGGIVQLYQADSAGRLQLVGEARTTHTAPGRDLRVQSGDAFDITAERVQTDYGQEQLAPPKRGVAQRQRITASYKVTISNARLAAVTVDVREARNAALQAARALVQVAARPAPVLVIPGNQAVAWWPRPLTPFAKQPLYAKYARYFGTDLTPTLALPGALIASALTSHGVAWGSLTLRVRDLAVKGHLPKREVARVRGLFDAAPREQARVLVVHHNVLRGDISKRMGLARWRQAQRRIAASGAEVVLCGHDHQEGADLLGGR